MVHFAKGNGSGRGSVGKLLLALRGYVARRRKRLVRIVETPVEVEKVVIQKVEVPEKIIEIYKVVEKIKHVPYSGTRSITELEGMPETVVDDHNVTSLSDRKRP